MDDQCAVIPLTTVFSLGATKLCKRPSHVTFFLTALSSFYHLCALQMKSIKLFAKADSVLHDRGDPVSSSQSCGHPSSADQLFLPLLPENTSLLPQTIPEPQVTEECGWLLSRAVSMETKVPVGEQKAAGVQVLVPHFRAVCL